MKIVRIIIVVLAYHLLNVLRQFVFIFVLLVVAIPIPESRSSGLGSSRIEARRPVKGGPSGTISFKSYVATLRLAYLQTFRHLREMIDGLFHLNHEVNVALRKNNRRFQATTFQNMLFLPRNSSADSGDSDKQG